MGFLRFNFQVPLPFRSRLSVNHVTDGQTDSTTNINALCPHAMGAGHNKRLFADLRTPNCVYGLQKNQNRHTTEKKIGCEDQDNDYLYLQRSSERRQSTDHRNTSLNGIHVS